MSKKLNCFLLIILFSLSPSFSEESYFDLDSYVTLDEGFTIKQAIDLALNNNPDIMIQQAALLNASGQLLQAKGSFDVKVGGETYFSNSYTPTDAANPSVQSGGNILYETVESSELTTNAFVEKLFAFGIKAKLNYQLSRGKQKYKDGLYATDSNYSAYGSPDYSNNGNVSLEISVPLLKGFNEAIADNNLKMAKTSYESMANNLEDTIAKVIMQTSETYWQFYIAYEQIVELKKMAEKNELRIVAVKRLVDSRMKTQNELLRIQVNALSTKRQLENAKIEYMNAKKNLAIQTGIPVEAIADPKFTLPEVTLSGEFPAVEDFGKEKLEEIILSRPDVQSLVKSCDAAARRLKLAKINARPDLNLSLTLGTTGNKYGGDAENYFAATGKNVRGLNYVGKINFSMPIQNNGGKGEIEQAEASYREALARLNKQKNVFVLQLQNAISALNIYKDTVNSAKSILESQEQVYINEQKRYDAGLSSVDFLLQQDTAWLEASMAYYQIYVTYLKYVMEYKYYTAGLVSFDADSETLYSLASEHKE